MPSRMRYINTAATIKDYEDLRATAFISTSAPGIHHGLKQLISAGVHTWVMARNGMAPHDQARTSIDASPAIASQRDTRDTIVALLASMTLQSITGGIDVHIQ